MPGSMKSVWYVLIRPKMYTMSGTLGEVVAFIKGYTGGLSKHQPDAPIVVEWVDFTDWLRRRLSVDTEDLFDVFVGRYGNNEAALKKLQEYFDEYKEVSS